MRQCSAEEDEDEEDEEEEGRGSIDVQTRGVRYWFATCQEPRAPGVVGGRETEIECPPFS